MKDGAFRRLSAGSARAALRVVGALGLALGTVVSIHGQAAEAISQPGQVTTTYLDYQEVSYSLVNWGGLRLTERSAAFEKEPAFQGDKVIRGTLELTGGGSNELAFAWDRSAGKLYLDLNGNLDLTDDAGGVFARQKGSRADYQTFTNLHLPFRTSAGTHPMLVDLNLYNIRRLQCSVAMRSFWQGKVTLQGEDWQVGLVATPGEQRSSLESGNLLLRPWSDRDKPFRLFSGALNVFPFPRKLFISNHAYQLQCTNEIQGDLARVRLQFVADQPKLGELKLTGESLQRVRLEGGPYLMILDEPGPVVKVPVGRYSSAKVCLQKGEAKAYLDQQGQTGVGRITVSETAPAVLTAGGPLTNSVSINRRGRNLSLTYRLVGAGGAYQMANEDRSHPPEFAVYRGDKKLASARFQYG